MLNPLFQRFEKKPITFLQDHIAAIIGVDATRTNLLLSNGRDLLVERPYADVLADLGLRDAAVEAGQIDGGNPEVEASPPE